MKRLTLVLTFLLAFLGFAQDPPALTKGAAERLFSPIQTARTDGLTMMASSRQATYLTRTIATAGTWDIYRHRFRNLLPEPVVSVILVYGNHTVNAPRYDGANANPIRVAAALELLSTTATNTQDQDRIPARFGGQRQVVIGGGDEVWSDPIPFYIAPQGDFFVRSGVSVDTNGHVYPGGGCVRGGTATFGINNGEGSSLAQASSAMLYDGGGSIGIGPLEVTYAPDAIYCRTASGKIYPSVMAFGDSITVGYSDAGDVDGSFGGREQGGHLKRAFEALGVPYAIGAYSGEQGASAVRPGYRQSRSVYGLAATHVVWAYGRNDFNNAQSGGTLTAVQAYAAMQATTLQAVREFAGRGYRFSPCTVLPEVGSTTGYTTAAGMLPVSGVADDARELYNAWLRDASALGYLAQARGALLVIGGNTGLLGTPIDVCAPIETNQAGTLTPNGGCLLVPSPVTYYDSGTATSGTTTTLVDSSKSWTVNQHRGRAVWIYAGQGQYSTATVLYNTATTLTMARAFSGSATPNSTSQYRIIDAATTDATHPASWGDRTIAAGILTQVRRFMAL